MPDITYIDPDGIPHWVKNGQIGRIGASVVPYVPQTPIGQSLIGQQLVGQSLMGQAITPPTLGAGPFSAGPAFGGAGTTGPLPGLGGTGMSYGWGGGAGPATGIGGAAASSTSPLASALGSNATNMATAGGMIDDAVLGAASTPGATSFMARAFPNYSGTLGGALKNVRAGALPLMAGSIGLNMLGSAIGNGATDTSGHADRADVGQFLSGAGTGGGMAGGLALALGASGPVGWGAAAAGAVGYGLYKAIWGSDKGPDKVKQTQTAVDKALASLQSHDPQLAATLREQLDAQMALPLSKDEKLQTLKSAATVIIQNTGIASQRKTAASNSAQQMEAIAAALGPMQARAQAQYDQTLAPTNAEIMRLAGQLGGGKSTYAKYAAQTQIAAQRAQLQQQAMQYQSYPMMLALQQQQQLNQQFAPISLYGSGPIDPASQSSSAMSPQLTEALAQYAK